MSLLISGLLIWVAVHLFPSLAADTRKTLAGKIGEIPYQGLFALSILLGLGLIILGWRSMTPSHIYLPEPALRHFSMLVVAIAFIVLTAANFKTTRVKQFIRHPQLTGVLLWAIGHLLANGDSRSLLLFSVLAVWAVVSMITINRRDGAWQKPTSIMPLYKEAMLVIIGIVLAAVVVRFHVYLSGIPLIVN